MKNKDLYKIKPVLLIFFISLSSFTFSQNPAKSDLKFINHLVDAGDFKEALYLLEKDNGLSMQMKDSINYLKGWCLYSLKDLLPSSENLIKVSPGSEFYLKSRFFAAYNYSHLGLYEKALEAVSKIETVTDKQLSLKNYELAGIHLLQGNYPMFEESFSKVDKNIFELSGSSENIERILGDLMQHKKKSPFIAGVLSGIVPGSGKFYAGKKGEAISAFIASVGLGLVTWENYRKDGLRDIKTMAFGTALLFSYAANIYGAIVSVNIMESEYNNNVKNSILFHLHIPLRNTFD